MHSWSKKNAESSGHRTEEQIQFRCHQILQCGKVLCPAYNRGNTACWHVSKTLCADHGESTKARKFEQCLTCPVFKTHAEADPRGWSDFVSDEVKEFIENDFCSSAAQKLSDDLEVAERKYRRLFEGSKDLIFITFTDGKFKEVNQACVDILRYSSREELYSLGSVEKVYDKTTHWKVFKRQIDRDGFVKDFEALFRRKDGKRLHCLLSGNAVRNKSGEIIGYLASSSSQACNMIGPGVSRTENAAIALIDAELDHHRGRTPVLLLPGRFNSVVQHVYGLGGRNCETHVAQCLGEAFRPNGVTMPTFLPESG